MEAVVEVKDQPQKGVKHEPQIIHVFVKRGTEQIKLDFTSPTATGLEIKTRAGGTAKDGLYYSSAGKDFEVPDDEVVALKEGQHFTLIPNGKVS